MLNAKRLQKIKDYGFARDMLPKLQKVAQQTPPNQSSYLTRRINDRFHIFVVVGTADNPIRATQALLASSQLHLDTPTSL